MNVEISITTRALTARAELFGIRRAVLTAAMGEAVKEKTREHLAGLAASRHTTANRLGATPTGHLEMATRAVESAPLTATAESASFTISHVGMIRALRDVPITPSKQFLTIPLNAIAYGRRAGEFEKVQLIQKGSGGSGKKKERKPLDPSVPAFLLVRSVTQRQDRSLLPSNAEWKKAGVDAAEELINAS